MASSLNLRCSSCSICLTALSMAFASARYLRLSLRVIHDRSASASLSPPSRWAPSNAERWRAAMTAGSGMGVWYVYVCYSCYVQMGGEVGFVQDNDIDGL